MKGNERYRHKDENHYITASTLAFYRMSSSAVEGYHKWGIVPWRLNLDYPKSSPIVNAVVTSNHNGMIRVFYVSKRPSTKGNKDWTEINLIK